MTMTFDEQEELLALRALYQSRNMTRADRVFRDLETLLNNVRFDPVCSPRAFRILAECILALRDETRQTKGTDE